MAPGWLSARKRADGIDDNVPNVSRVRLDVVCPKSWKTFERSSDHDEASTAMLLPRIDEEPSHLRLAKLAVLISKHAAGVEQQQWAEGRI
jgi:hypothetical protein